MIDHSTIAPDAARRIAASLAARGIDMLDAPVSGGSGARQRPARSPSWSAVRSRCSIG